jgi:hypothetical protein
LWLSYKNGWYRFKPPNQQTKMSSLATALPMELVNHILSYRPIHPVAKILFECKYCGCVDKDKYRYHNYYNVSAFLVCDNNNCLIKHLNNSSKLLQQEERKLMKKTSIRHSKDYNYRYIYKIAWFKTKRHLIPHTSVVRFDNEELNQYITSYDYHQGLVRIESIRVYREHKYYQIAIDGYVMYRVNNIDKYKFKYLKELKTYILRHNLKI